MEYVWLSLLRRIYILTVTPSVDNDTNKKTNEAKVLRQKPDPHTTKKLSILVLTRIFLLTQNHQSLIRELTTPSIPSFVTTCLNLITLRVSSQDDRKIDLRHPLLDTVLQAISQMLPHHPSSLRPFIPQLKSLLGPLLAPTPSNVLSKGVEPNNQSSPTSSSVALAQRLYALLPYCAPKNTSNEEWLRTVRTLIQQSHETADYVFRAVIEDRPSSARVASTSTNSRSFDQIIGEEDNDELGLPGWRGIYAGVERLVGLMQSLQAHLATTSPVSLLIPIGSFWSVIERTLSIVAPSSGDQNGQDVLLRINPEVEKEEREGLWSTLMLLHEAAIETLSLLLLRMDTNSVAFAHSAMEQVLWTFRSYTSKLSIRKSIYVVISQIVELFGPSMRRSVMSSMSLLIQACCEDILPSTNLVDTAPQESANGAKKPSRNGTFSDNADSYLNPHKTTSQQLATTEEVHDTALILLQSVLKHVPAESIPHPVRSQIDRTAILTQQEQLMFASVMNPATQTGSGNSHTSILPFFARNFPNALEVEAIIHPRMPVLPPRRHQDKEDVPSDDDNNNNEYNAVYPPFSNLLKPSYSQNNETLSRQEPVVEEPSHQPLPSYPFTNLPNSANTTTYSNLSSISDYTKTTQPIITPTTDSNKRAREDVADLADPSPLTTNMDANSQLLAAAPPSTKRVRLADSEEILVVPESQGDASESLLSRVDSSRKKDVVMNDKDTEIPVSTGTRTTTATSEVRPEKNELVQKEVGISAVENVIGGEDSDSSFEMPKLYTEDSDEEEDENEEGEGEGEGKGEEDFVREGTR